MRSDRNLPAEFRDEKQWTLDPFTGIEHPEFERLNSYGTEFHRHSYSGNERNKLFLNQQGNTFVDVSGISGADEIADSRSWIKWDFDRDGWQDIALVNANKPLLGLFRNQMEADRHPTNNNVIAVQFIGGNRKAAPSTTASARDGYGTKVLIETDDLKIRREHRCGEGYAAQNSPTVLIGIGGASTAQLSVAWPSREKCGPITVKAGQLVTCFEDRSQSPNQTFFALRKYGSTGRPSDRNSVAN